jgi:hypothetical protein
MKDKSTQFRKWLDTVPDGIDGQVRLPFEASLDRDEWLAVADEARRVGVTVEQMCGAIVARVAEDLASGNPAPKGMEIELYVRGLN